MKKLIFLVLLFSSSIVCSEELKLSCDIRLIKDETGKKQEVIQYNEMLTIKENGKTKFILPTSTNLSSVSTETDGLLGKVEVTDLSNSSTWNIDNLVFNEKNPIVTKTTLKIDRTTGSFYYYHNFSVKGKVGMLTHTGDGLCKKFDESTKKF